MQVLMVYDDGSRDHTTNVFRVHLLTDKASDAMFTSPPLDGTALYVNLARVRCLIVAPDNAVLVNDVSLPWPVVKKADNA